MTHLKIAGTGRYLPKTILTNEYFEFLERLNQYDRDNNIIKTLEGSTKITSQKIIEITGIKERRKSAPNEFPSDMGYKAAEIAIEKSGINVDSLVGIIVATVTEDTNFPSAAVKIQKYLGAKNCFAYDIANACAGFPEALAQANSRVSTRPGNYLVISSECLTKMTDYTDLNSTLFGDGAGAAVLIPTEEPVGILADYSKSNPFDDHDIFIFRDSKRTLRMPEGQSVMKEAVRCMLESARCLKEKIGWERADIYIPHQANGRILDAIEKRVSSEGSFVYKNIERYGNMSSATCAVALDEAIEKEIIKEGSKVIITSFGAGLVTAAVAIQF